MNIAIVGYGKMGQGIHALLPKGWNLLLICDPKNTCKGVTCVKNLKNAKPELLSKIDLFFEFTEPKTAKQNIEYLANVTKKAKIVSGTTAWDPKELSKKLDKNKTALLVSPNFSVGINALSKVIKDLSKSLSKEAGFEANMVEYHHKHKKDAPSGTAKILASLIEETGQNCPIVSIRTGSYPGTHIIEFESEFETIHIKHEARSRKVFCAGAIEGAKLLLKQKKSGLFKLADLIKK